MKAAENPETYTADKQKKYLNCTHLLYLYSLLAVQSCVVERDRTGLSVDEICSLLNLKATYLMLEGRIYQQVHGTAMGSPVSVVVANLVMEDIECRPLSSFHTLPHFWRRYVDDTCTVLPRGLVESFHAHLNSIDPNIQFTVERESEGQLPFLDVLLTREDDGSISTSVFRKATHTDQYLAYESHHPTAHKKAVVRTLMNRAETLSSSGVSRAQEEERIQQSLQKNGYPVAFITRHSLPQPVPQNDKQTARASVTVPYIHGLSQSIRRVLSPLAIKVTFRPFRTLMQELVHLKDPVPEKQRKGVVYSIRCGDCPRTYIKKTGRTLDHHLAEHRWDLRNGDVFAAGHQVDLSKATVIDTHPHAQICCLLESWHIQHEQASLSRGKGTLPGLYATLMD